MKRERLTVTAATGVTTASAPPRCSSARARSAADIQLNQNVEIVNPDQHICTLDKKKKLEMTAATGMAKMAPAMPGKIGGTSSL